MTRILKYSLLLIVLFTGLQVSAQVVIDSTGQRLQPSDTVDRKIDSIINQHSPRKAAIRSAILPGWGQAYNKKYWKIPIVYGALGVSTGFFVYNLQWYRRTRFAYTVVATNDSANFGNIHQKLQAFVQNGDETTLRYYRNEFRKGIDYSALVFILLWGLNVVDATVDAHLKSFDVSPDLSLRFKPGYSEMAGTNGVSLVLTFK